MYSSLKNMQLTERIVFFTITIFLLLIPSKVLATSYGDINYSGRIVEPSGKPFEGPVNLNVLFYHVSSEGSPIIDSLAFSNVELDNGIFQISFSSLTDEQLHEVFSGSDPVYIEIVDTTHSVTYPRQNFSIVPYALKVPVDGKTLSFNASGKLILGTSVPEDGKYLKGNSNGTLSWDSPGDMKKADKATTADAQTGVDDTKWMTPLKVKSAIEQFAGALGESNIGSNVTSGGGVGIYKDKLGVTLEFLSLKASTGMSVSQVGNDITIATSITQYTDSAARTASVADSVTNGVTTIAPSQNAVYNALALKSDATHSHSNATTGAAGFMSASDKSKLDGLEAGADITDATNVAAAGAIMDGDFSTNGLMKRTAAGTYTTITDSSTNWDAAYTATNAASASSGNNTIVKRDGSGNFAAATISATQINTTGQILSNGRNATADSPVNWNNSNLQYTTNSCGAFTFSNMQSGGSYTFIVQGTTSATCTFTHAGLTFLFAPTNGATIAGKQTVYTILVAGSYAYVTWVGF